ncbi:unnamed protein product [Microthlaspi erraticum]|uniref:Uncharacterized protein n=1 Tax=Microthlaspi erraticum TaxID=1685480 RepID=A0A6D2JQ09_9BRAS|nr:unnamed protein product [Microthlaspi erraticum]
MDFIKTSSLRALIELNFQRNWNGLIWMSRKGVITKRVETVQTALSRKQRPTAQSGWPRNYCFALGQTHIRPSEGSAKVRSRPADHVTRPGKHCPAIRERMDCFFIDMSQLDLNEESAHMYLKPLDKKIKGLVHSGLRSGRDGTFRSTGG